MASVFSNSSLLGSLQSGLYRLGTPVEIRSAYSFPLNSSFESASLLFTGFEKSRLGPGSITSASLDFPRYFGNRSVRTQAVSGMQMTIRSVPVQVANELLEAGHLYLDVRTPEEFMAGHVEGAFNVPFMYKQNGGMVKNENFVDDVSDLFDKDMELVVGCQSGKRSMMAATELQAADFTGVTDVGGGFMAWKQSELPFVTGAATHPKH